MILYFLSGILVFCFLRKFSSDPCANHITVSTHLHCKPVFTLVSNIVIKTQISGCRFVLFSFYLFNFLVFRWEIHLVRDEL